MSDELQNPVLTINIALVGTMPTDSKKNFVSSKLKRIIETAALHLRTYADTDYGFADQQVDVCFLIASALINAELTSAIKDLIYPNASIKCVTNSSLEETKLSCDKITYLDIHTNNSEIPLIFSWLSAQADFAIVLTDELIEFPFADHCRSCALPAAIINTNHDEHVLWTEKSFYDSYDEEKLKNYLDMLLPTQQSIEQSNKSDKDIFGQKLLWGGLYKKYMKKYKATINTEKPFTKDRMMDLSEMDMIPENVEKSSHYYLRDWFYKFDGVAIEYAQKYRSSIYLRAVIPLVVTVSLAIGFYIETLLSPWKISIPGTKLQLWSIVAGIGFFVHALLNLYIYRLSENNIAKKWHKSFVDNRFIAEALRLAVHFMSFGVPMDYSQVLSTYGSNIKKDNTVIRRLRSIIRGTELPEVDFSNKKTTQVCLNSLEELIEDQIAYHKTSANRYVNICADLRRFSKRIFYIGFIFILFRGCFQLYLSFSGISGEINSQPIQPIVKSFANMLALLFPAWAGYFSSKLMLCNFEGLYNHDITVLDGLKEIKQLIFDKRNKGNINYQDIYELSGHLNKLILNEVSDWYLQINTKTITKL